MLLLSVGKSKVLMPEQDVPGCVALWNNWNEVRYIQWWNRISS